MGYAGPKVGAPRIAFSTRILFLTVRRAGRQVEIDHWHPPDGGLNGAPLDGAAGEFVGRKILRKRRCRWHVSARRLSAGIRPALAEMARSRS
jgi:hypothetical protein